MRCVLVLGCLVALGCTKGQTGQAKIEPVQQPADLVAQGASAGTPNAGTDWPWFLGPTGNSVSAEKGIVAPWPAEGLRVVWHKQVGTGYGMPSISKGKLYQFDRHGNQSRLTCMKSTTGEFLWKFECPTDYHDMYGYNNGPRCCPVIDDNRVYTFSAEGILHCVRAADGKQVWKVDTRAAFGVIQNFFGVGSTPVVEGDLLIVQVGGSPNGSEDVPFEALKGNGTGIVAFDKLTGKVKYHITNELAGYAGPALATIGERRWCFVFGRSGLTGFDPAHGKVDFHYPWRARVHDCVNASNPVVIGDKVFISETYGPGSSLLRVKPGGYELIWDDADKSRDKSMQCHWNTAIHHDGYLYGSSGRHSNIAELRCIELNTGKVMWRQPGLSLCSLLMVDGHFICLSELGDLRLLKVNPHKYEEVSHLMARDKNGLPLLEYPCWAAPILSHGLMYLRGKDRLVCLELIR